MSVAVAHDEHQSEEYHEAQAKFDELSGYQLEAKAKNILAGLSFRQIQSCIQEMRKAIQAIDGLSHRLSPMTILACGKRHFQAAAD